jgi:hypothetical protein
MATQLAKSGIEPSFFERIGDKFSSFVEGCVNTIARIMGGSSNERRIKTLGYYRPNNSEAHVAVTNSPLAKINAFESQMQALTDEELKSLSTKLKERLAKGETLDQLLPEAFAACREAGRRTKGMRHYDVQMIGAMILHGYGEKQGSIAEMVTGEGKTLVATPSAYLNALEGKGVHVVTVNDYLARRDCEWMLPIYNALGVSAAYIQSDMDPEPAVAPMRRYHLRHRLRVRLRLSARQHENRAPRRHSIPSVLPPGAAYTAELRHHRRGGQHSHRRGTHAAHHQRSSILGRPSLRRSGQGCTCSHRTGT